MRSDSEIESRMVVSRGWRRGMKEELLFNGHSISILPDESILEMDGGDGCTTV